MWHRLRKTTNDRLGGTLRIMLGIVFFMAGILKVIVPSLGTAFAGQLAAANVPLQGLVNAAFPVVEMLLGILMIVGLHTRLAAALSAISMLIATYVHVAVEDPALFPLQPVEPIGPLVLLAMLLYLLWRGGGAWSFDLKDAG